MSDSNRLKDLFEYDLLNDNPEEELTDPTELAARICKTRLASIALIGYKTIWLKAK